MKQCKIQLKKSEMNTCFGSTSLVLIIKIDGQAAKLSFINVKNIISDQVNFNRQAAISKKAH